MESKISHDLDIYILTGRKQKVEVKMANQEQPNNLNIRDDARHFASGPRGQYILAQALFYGIQSLESVQPEIYQETSNISDMKFLQHAFDFPPELFEPNPGLEKVLENYAQDTKEIS